MAYEIHIPSCIHDPPHPLHLPTGPPPDKPLRIQLEGPLVAIQRLLPDATWHTHHSDPLCKYPQPGAEDFAKLAFRAIYGREVCPVVAGDMVLQDEVGGWTGNPPDSPGYLDYYGVTFDHLVHPADPDPDTLHFVVIELEVEGGPFANGVEYANRYLQVKIDPAEYFGKRVLVVPRCCTTRKGTQDRGRINGGVVERKARGLRK